MNPLKSKLIDIDIFSTKIGLRLPGKLIADGTQQGFLLYGPYLKFLKGRYRITLQGSLLSKGSSAPFIDCVHNRGSLSIFYSNFPKFDGLGFESFEIYLDHDVEDLEIRVWVNFGTILHISGVLIEHSNSPSYIIPKSISASNQNVFVLITGIVREPDLLKKQFSFYHYLKQKGIIRNVVWSTWVGTIDAYPEFSILFAQYGFKLVESIIPSYKSPGHFAHQILSLSNGLKEIPYDSFVLRTRTDKCHAGEYNIAKFLFSNSFMRHPKPIKSPFIYKIGLVGFHTTVSKTSPSIFNFNDRTFFGYCPDLRKLIETVNILDLGQYSSFPEQILFASCFLNDYPIIKDFFYSFNQLDHIKKYLSKPSDLNEKVYDDNINIIRNPIFNKALVAEREILYNNFYDFITGMDFLPTTTYREIDPLNYDIECFDRTRAIADLKELAQSAFGLSPVCVSHRSHFGYERVFYETPAF